MIFLVRPTKTWSHPCKQRELSTTRRFLTLLWRSREVVCSEESRTDVVLWLLSATTEIENEIGRNWKGMVTS